MAPTKQRAAFLSETGVTFGLVDVPKPGPGQVLVKIIAAAQNPVDDSRIRIRISSPRI